MRKILMIILSFGSIYVNLYLEWDFDLYGKVTEGTVMNVRYGDFKGNTGTYQEVRVSYQVKGKTYTDWFSSGTTFLNRKATLQIKYSTLFPRFAERYHERMDSWEDRIPFTFFMTCFLSLAVFIGFLQEKSDLRNKAK